MHHTNHAHLSISPKAKDAKAASSLQASPATLLTLQARILAIAQYVNAEISKIEESKRKM